MRKGFTLIELMIVIAIIAIIAAIAIPSLLESRVSANEANASSSLKSGISAAQVTFMGEGLQDADADNVGEAGAIADLCGLRARTGAAIGQAVKLPGPLVNNAAGTVRKSANNYFFTMFTPNADNTGMITEGTALAVPPFADQAAERNWMCVAVPQAYGDTGRRVFIISHEGQVRSPTATADTYTFFPADPTLAAANKVPTDASVLAGANDALTTDNVVGGGFDAAYPFYGK